MAVRLKSEFTSQNDIDYKIEIHDSEWLGGTSTFVVGSEGFSLEYTGETDDIISPILASSLNIPAFVENAAFETFIDDLTTYQEIRFHVEVYKDNSGYELFWTGWITQDLVTIEDVSMPYVIDLKATDGIGMLANIDYNSPNNLLGTGPLTEVEKILRNSIDKIGLKAVWETNDVYLETSVDWWETTIQTYSTTKDTLSEQALDVRAFMSIDDNGDFVYTKVFEVLRQLAVIYNARIYQSGGRWVFEQYGTRAGLNRYVTTYKKDGTVIATSEVSDDITFDQTTSAGARLGGGQFSYLPAVSKVSIDYKQKMFSPNSPPYTFNLLDNSHDLGYIQGGSAVQLSMEGAHNYSITSSTNATGNDGLIAVVFRSQIKLEDASNPGTFYYWTRPFNGYNIASTAVFGNASWSTSAGYYYYALPFSKVSYGELTTNVGPVVTTTDLPVSGALAVINEFYNKYDPANNTAYVLASHQTESWETIITFSRLKAGQPDGQIVKISSSNTNSKISTSIEMHLGEVSISNGLFQTGDILAYNGTAWVASLLFRKGSTGSGLAMLRLMCAEAAALHYAPVRRYEGAVINGASVGPRLVFDSSIYLTTSASFIASDDTWSMSGFEIDRNRTTIGDVDPIEVPALRTLQGVSGISNNPDDINTGRIGGMNVDVTQDRIGPFQQVTGGAAIVGGLEDSEGSFGSSGQVLSSTVTGLSWITSASSNDYVTGMTFNTSDGIVTLTRSGGLADITTDLDGRYLTTHPAIPNSGSIDNSNGVVVQDITIDAYGHSTAWGTVDLDDRFMQLGEPQAVTVKNMEATATLTKGTPVYAVDPSSSGNIVGVKAADASSSATMPAVVIMNESVTAGSEGEALIVGVITGVDTSSFTSGDVVYVASGGGFTNVKPTGTNLIQNLGVVMKVHATNGSGVIYGSGRANDVPNIPNSQAWVGNASGVATPTTLNITNWDTAYTYSQVGHLPLAGGTLTGELTVTGKLHGITAGTANTDAVNVQQLNNATTGVLVYQGVWNAATNTPTLTSATGTIGGYYIVSVDGATNLDGITDWKVGDWAVFSDMPTDAWQKIDNTSILGGAGTGGSLSAWTGSGTSLTLGDAPVTYSGNNVTVAGTVAASNLSGTNTGDQDLSPYAPLASPTFTGSPRSVTPATASNDTSVATTAYVKAQGYSTTAGTVTSVAMTVPTGLTVSGTPITTSGTLAVVFASGYSIPTNTGQSNWNTAYTYSTVGHLPLAGGTLTGDLSISGGNGGQLLITSGNVAWDASIDLDTGDSNGQWRIKAEGSDETFHITNVDQGGASAFTLHPTTKNATFAGTITATGGTSTQWNTAYGWGDHAGLYLSLGGGTMSGDVDMGGNRITEGVFVTQSGTSDDFVKGDGTLDSTEYLAVTGGTLSGDVTFTGATHHAMWDKSASALEFWDNAKLTFGDPGGTPDLEIYHDGSNSYIKETGTGNLEILADSLSLLNAAGSEYYARFYTNGSAYLYHNGVAKLNTTSTGVTVTGDADVSSTVLVGTNNSIFAENNLRFKSAGAAYIDHNTVGQSIKFRTSVSSSLDTTPLTITGANATFAGANTHNKIQSYYSGSYISGWKFSDYNGGIWYDAGADDLTVSAGHANSQMLLNSGGATALTLNAAQLATFAGNVNLGDNKKLRFGAGEDLQIYHDGSNSYIKDTGTGNLLITSDGASVQINKGTTENMAEFIVDGAVKLYYDSARKLETTSTGATVTGSIQMSDDTDTASASKVGTLRYRTSGDNSYVDMCMQTGATTYEWINILENNW